MKKYNTEAAKYYRKSICLRARNLPVDEKAPPKNAQEAAERAAEETQRLAKESWSKTTTFFQETDEKYQIGKTTADLAAKTKAGFMSLFAGASAPA